MPPKTKFDKEAIVEAAFAIAKEEGFAGITARSVAKRLRSSVAPIYLNFATIDDLIKAVVERVFALSDELLAKQKGPDLFENIGKASLVFAREYPVFFRELVMQKNPYVASYETFQDSMIEALAEDETMRGLTYDERKRLLLKMRIFQTGLSVMVANDHLPSWLDEQAAEALLLEMGEDLLRIQQIKQKETEQ
ncbi:TetR family transcriptional regulator [Methanosarcina sp. 2.H.T.1A.6]|uniref:TetR/AcrR family transcriptional regulator n=1 Tax=unclassified Methanosarcina TaxID=2644672 RepID=UPI00062250B2|nr:MULTISPECIES: TetR family transcriptional regulator [unclassified Methanosarcina]KKG16117.1 TetR family transcriptional regulator [Methanosarcina sp. 2.H.T.1A.15]KKG16419.1 TetR family transcriptional regulator [Methanosarcina sp. 2.H.T.1A.3]KKG21514.1 TetR family transcriptional regulator [Methanosarcina sp. 2.H.T.1A.6]KKG27414.1 TetR family transcriptional regulator [Methanosarcina sp. 2.H.T.1A.8]